MRSALPRSIHLPGRQFGSVPLSRSSPFLRRAVFRHQISKRNVTTTPATAAAVGSSKLVNFFYGTTILLGLGVVYIYITDTRASIHRWFVVPTLRLVYQDPERAHEVGNYALKGLWRLGLYPRERGDPDNVGDLEVEVFGHTLRNPIGTSAGIDKHADIPDPLLALGPSIIEIGGTTPQPQPGNEKPRVFRLSSQNAMINRYGLNSEGADHVAARLRHRVREFAYQSGLGHDEEAERLVRDGKAGVPPGSLTPGKLLAINIAKNKSTPEGDVQAIANDYVYCVERLAPYADILVVNVSSPNTPGLRSLQQGETLKQILSAVVKAAKATDRKTPPAVMVKVSPDEDSEEQVSGICQAVWDSGVDGVIVGNTTNRRPPSLPHLGKLTASEEQHLLEQGGFSGPHLFERTVALVKKYKKTLGDGSLPEGPPLRGPGKVAAEAEKLKATLSAKDAEGPSHPKAKADKSTTASPATEAKASNAKSNTGNSEGKVEPDQVRLSVETETIPLHNIAEKPDSEKQPLIRLPSKRQFENPAEALSNPKNTGDESATISPTTISPEASSSQGNNTDAPLYPISSKSDRKPSDDLPSSTKSSKSPSTSKPEPTEKIIFATGGITNGRQALEVLNAGASVAMVYTALVYGGAGTISRIKDEMRTEMKKNATDKKLKS